MDSIKTGGACEDTKKLAQNGGRHKSVLREDLPGKGKTLFTDRLYLNRVEKAIEQDQ